MSGGTTGAVYDYGFRIYDSRIAKFLSVDPLTGSYPWYTPYQFAGNKPIWAIDLDGLEEYIYKYSIDDKLNVALIKKERNVEMRNKINANGTHSSSVYEAYNKATGEKLCDYEKGKVQFQYYYKGADINIHRKLNGDFAKGAGDFIETNEGGNWFNSIFIGPDNPVLGKIYDYRYEPQDLVDAAALQHDKDYDAVGAAGPIDAIFNTQTLQADIDLVQRSNTVIGMFKNKEKDPYTGLKISEATLTRAKKVKKGFSEIATQKAIDSGMNYENFQHFKLELDRTK